MSPTVTTELTVLPRSPSLSTFFDNLDSFAEAPEGVAKLRELILDLAVRGKLVEQNENDEPASELLERTFAEKTALEESGEIKKQPALSPIQDSEILFDIPSNWCWVRAAEISYPISSGTTPAKSVFQSEPDGGIPYLKVYNIRDQEIDFNYKPQYIDQEHHATKMKRSILVPGMVVLNIVGPPLGKTAIIPDTFPEWNCNQAISFFRLIGDILPRYFHLYLRAGVFLRNIALIGTAGQDNISVTKCKHIVVPVPPLSEQRRIVSKVNGLMSLCDELESRGSERVRLRERASRSCLDRLVSSRSRRDLSSAWQRLSDHFEVLYACPETLAHLRQSILQLAVQGKLVPQDPNDEPASQLLERIQTEKESATNGKKRKSAKVEPISPDDYPFELPSNWKWARFSDVATIASNLVKPAAFQDVPHIAPNNIEKETGILLDYRTVAEDEVKSSNHRFFSGQILYSKIRPNLSKAVLIDFGGLCSADMYPIDAHIFAPYLLKYILSETFLGMVVKTDTRVAMPKTNQAELNKVLVAVPPLAEQKRIVAKVDQLLSQCDELSARLRDRQSATQQLLTATIHELLHEVGSDSAMQR